MFNKKVIDSIYLGILKYNYEQTPQDIMKYIENRLGNYWAYSW